MSVDRAEQLLTRSLADTTRREARQRSRLAAVVDDERLRALTFALTDEVLRVNDNPRAAARFRAIVRDIGVPPSLGLVDRWSLRVGALVASALPWIVMPLVRRRVLQESSGVVLPADDPAFAHHLAARRGQGFPLNVNVLGEAILSDDEADARMRLIRERVARPDVDYISLKISAVVANLDVLAFDHSVDAISERLRVLYRDAMSATPTVFVNLDMEEYRDLPLTIAALVRVLSEPEFEALHAGVVLQAYLPDSHAACEQLCSWATERHRRTGGTLKVRVVKGANLAMEKVEA
jgi:RHH-type proline utilization regulon transcriptional repressor/proline dehydrogenase/delta 1-pyrroline-5-carboxylate dehydrogenase